MLAFLEGVAPTKAFLGIVATLIALLAGGGYYLKLTIAENAALEASIKSLTLTLEERNKTIEQERKASDRVQKSNRVLQRRNDNIRRDLNATDTTTTDTAVANILCREGLATDRACSSLPTPVPTGGLPANKN